MFVFKIIKTLYLFSAAITTSLPNFSVLIVLVCASLFGIFHCKNICQ